MGPEKTFHQDLPMPLPYPMPILPDQSVSFQGLVNPRLLDMRSLGTSPGYDDDIHDI